jgi:hypothetical protein
MNELIAIAPGDLATVWPSIRDDVASIEAPDGCLPEDVYMACKTNGATLFILKADGKQIGFMVARLMLPDLHIWQLKAENGFDVLTTFRTQLMQLARGAKATKITYGSSRKAWAQVAAQHKFKMRMVVYECEVDEPPEGAPALVASDPPV